jgi:hypothetical protein
MLPALSELILLYTILIFFGLFIKTSQYYVYTTKQPRFQVSSKLTLHQSSYCRRYVVRDTNWLGQYTTVKHSCLSSVLASLA